MEELRLTMGRKEQVITPTPDRSLPQGVVAARGHAGGEPVLAESYHPYLLTRCTSAPARTLPTLEVMLQFA